MRKKLADIDGVIVTVSEKTNEKAICLQAFILTKVQGAESAETGLDVEPAHISLDEPIKAIGKHAIAVKVGDKRGRSRLSLAPLNDATRKQLNICIGQMLSC